MQRTKINPNELLPSKLPSINLVNKVLAEKYFDHFVKQAWKYVERKALVWNWHLEAICNHLQALSEFRIKNLVINIPPRHTKSLLCAVMFPAWVWTTRPERRFIFSSYAAELSHRDSVRCRRLIQSTWYQSFWGEVFHIVEDQNQKKRFENNIGGHRISTSVTGLGTGEGGDHIFADDPHNVRESESETRRREVLFWWDEQMVSRVDDADKSTKCIIMQRVHEEDLSGHCLEKTNEGTPIYEHLCLPAEYEENYPNPCRTSLNFSDPRSKEGELLNPKRFSKEVLSQWENELGPYAYSGQFQQRPSPRGGDMFRIANFLIQQDFARSNIVASVRYWDKAGTDAKDNKNAAFTAGVLMHRLSNDFFVVEDVVRGQWNASDREKIIDITSQTDSKNVVYWVEQEPGSGGKESAENTQKRLIASGRKCYIERVTGAKEHRAEPYAMAVNESKTIILLSRDWTKDFINEHEKAPVGKWKDQWDSAGGAFNKLARMGKAGAW